MATTLTVHIGARKTGTTFVQRALQARHSELLAHGVLYPVNYRPGKGDYNHVAAVYEVMRAAGRSSGRWRDLPLGTHQALADAVNAHPGAAIISAEALSGLPTVDIQAFLRPFTAPVRVVFTARDLGRVLPSSWQQNVRNTHTMSLTDYIAMRAQQRADGPDAWETADAYSFWRMFAYGRLARRWADIVGADRVHCVPTPPAGSDSSILWRRFCEAAELPQTIAADTPAIPVIAANTGSTAAEAEFLRAFNERGRQLNIDRRDLKRLQRDKIATLLTREDRGAPLLLPASALDEVRAWAEADRSELRESGASVHGDLAELDVLDSCVETEPVSAAEVAAVGAHLVLSQERQEGANAGLRLARRFKRMGSA